MSGTISLIAGGWSFRHVDHKKVPGQVIAVNDTLLHLRAPIHSVISMDRLWTENRWEHVTTMRHQTYVRASSLKNVRIPEQPWSWLHKFECDRMRTTFGETPSQLNGRNSGACGMNLAFVRKPDTLFLFGFDMCVSPEGKAHWYPAYDWVYKGDKGGTGKRTYLEWATDFRDYRRQFDEIGCKVVNVSLASQITAFERVSAEEVGCGL